MFVVISDHKQLIRMSINEKYWTMVEESSRFCNDYKRFNLVIVMIITEQRIGDVILS